MFSTLPDHQEGELTTVCSIAYPIGTTKLTPFGSIDSSVFVGLNGGDAFFSPVPNDDEGLWIMTFSIERS